MPPAPSTCSTRYFPASRSPCWIMGAPSIPRRAGQGPCPRDRLENQLFAELLRIADVGAVGTFGGVGTATPSVDARVEARLGAVCGRDALGTVRVRTTDIRIALGSQYALTTTARRIARVAIAV